MGVGELRGADGAGGGDAEPAESLADAGADRDLPAGADERGVGGNGGEFWRAVRRGEPDDGREPHVAGARADRGETPHDPDPVPRVNADLRSSGFQLQFERDRGLQRGQVHPDLLQWVHDRRTLHRML